VELSVVLDEYQIRLDKVLSLKPGDQIPLNVESGALVAVRCGDVKLFDGKIGQKNHNVAVKIESDMLTRAGPE
jgi:flagellar motor switch protein FliM